MSQLVLTMGGLAVSLGGGQRTGAVMVDFSGAFNVVAHRRLVLRLGHCGVSGPTCAWILGFLVRGGRGVVVGGGGSGWVRVQSGVPRGGVLGPLLFLVCVNDIADRVASAVRLFADGCVLCRAVGRDADADLLWGALAGFVAGKGGGV